MHNPHFMIDNMEHHKREYAQRNRNAWKRPPAPRPQGSLRRAKAAFLLRRADR